MALNTESVSSRHFSSVENSHHAKEVAMTVTHLRNHDTTDEGQIDPSGNDFEALVDALREKLGPSSGIDSEDVDPSELQALMAAYTSNESDWAKYKFEKPTLPYTRNLVDKGNGKCNLVSLLGCVSQSSLTRVAHSGVDTRQSKPRS
jgi:hypothetical protein